jgi:elongation factor Ts
MNIQSIRELREMTHLSVSICKAALEQVNGDVAAAVEHLQKQNVLKTPDALVVPTEGVVRAQVVDGIGRIAEINCQTDFCSRSELFSSFVDRFLTSDIDRKNLIVEYFAKTERGQLLCRQLGEKIAIKRADTLWVDKMSTDVDSSLAAGVCRCYNHHSGKIAVLLSAMVEEEHMENPRLLSFLDDCAMQIAATNPLFLTAEPPFPTAQPDIITTGIYAAQKAIFTEQAISKPEKMREKIIAGKMANWYSEVVFRNQESLLQPKQTIKSLQEALQKELNSKLVLCDFTRYELGA